MYFLSAAVQRYWSLHAGGRRVKALVIGSTGVRGNARVSELVARGKEVRATVRHGSPPRALNGLKELDSE
jgi:nucleoside-diphosphate-sugar epimerase